MAPVGKKAASYIVLACILFPLSAATVFLRVLAIRKKGRSFKSHDYLVFLSLLCLVGYLVAKFIAIARGGHGLHVYELSFDQIVVSLKVLWIGEWLWATSVTSFRLAILFLYMEIFKAHKIYHFLVYTAIVVLLGWMTLILTICLICRPISYNWDPTLDGTCGNLRAGRIASAVFTLTIDIWVVFLPLPVVWKLQMTSQRKWAFTACFALGLFTASVNLGRLIDTIKCPTKPDFLYCSHNSSIFVTAEMAAGILVACVPTLGAIFFSARSRDPNPNPRAHDEEGPPTIGSKHVKPRNHNRTVMGSLAFSEGERRPAEDVELVDPLTSSAAEIEVQSQVSRVESIEGRK